MRILSRIIFVAMLAMAVIIIPLGAATIIMAIELGLLFEALSGMLMLSSLSCGIKRFSNSARFSVRRKRYAAITQWNLHGAQLSWSSIWNTTRVRIFSLNLKRTLKRSLILSSPAGFPAGGGCPE